MITCADLLNEYGEAIRYSWGDIDGRCERMKLEDLADAIREHGNAPLLPEEVKKLRQQLDVCSEGNGHWTEFCLDYGCEA